MIAPIEDPEAGTDSLDVTELRELVRIGERYEAAWRSSATPPPFEPFLAGFSGSRLAATERHLRSLASELAGGEATPPPTPARYLLRRRIGAGGMGVVHRAYDQAARKDVAIKQIKPELLEGLEPGRRAELIARFEREGRLAAGVEHDHVVTIYDIGTSGGVPYFTMRWIDGGTLADRLASGPITARAAAELLLPVVLATAEAHRMGVIHRDIKPRNIFIDGSGRPYLGDFGLAKASGLTEADDLTSTGMLIGTAPYMAPEQILAARRADARSDVYALGATLYRAITGRPPFQAPELAQVLGQVLEVEPVSPRRLNPGLSRDLERVALKCLAKAPGDRYPTADALAEDLRRFLDGRPVAARPLGPLTRSWRWARRSPSSAALVGVGVALTLGTGLGTSWWRDRSRADAADRAITALMGARAAEVPALLAGVESFRPRERATLDAALARADPDSSGWLNLALASARLGSPPPGLAGRVFGADADQVDAILRGLPRGDAFEGPAREILASESKSEPARLRAGAILARHDPGGRDWAGSLAIPLLDEPPGSLGTWADLLRPIAPGMAGDLLKHLRDRTLPDSQRLAAAQVLSAWCSGPESDGQVVEAIAAADGAQIRVLAAALRRRPPLMDDLARRAGSGEGRVEDRARWAAALLLAGRPEILWPLLRQGPDNGLRTLLLVNLAGWRIPPEAPLDRLEVETDASTRRALILALGQYRVDLLPPELRRRASARLSVAYSEDPDPGTHSAARWTLSRAWSLALPEVGRPSGAGWVVEGGLPLAFVPGRAIRPFAIGTTEVTAAEYYRLCPEIRKIYEHRSAPADDRPVCNVTYEQAVRYCEKLSQEVGKGRTFRLPTETEWEEAAAAGAKTTWFHGEGEGELNFFAWTVANSGGHSHLVAELRPNDFGLFDALGNVFEWHVPRAMAGDNLPASTRGGSFQLIASKVKIRPTPIIPKSPKSGETHTGFRVARDLDAAELAAMASSP